MRNNQDRYLGLRFRRFDIAFCVLSVVFPFIYGYTVLAFAKPLTAPDEAYIHFVKPVHFALILGFYLYAAYYANSRVPGLSRVGRAVALVSAAIFVISILIFSFADICKNLGVIGPDGELHREPSICLYFSVVTWTTLGYGDFRPATNEGRLFAGVEAMLGYIVMGIFIATVTNLLFELQRNELPTSLVKAQASQVTSASSTKGEAPKSE